MRSTLKLLLSLSLLILINSACVTINDGELCSVAGNLANGGVCTHLISNTNRTLDFDNYLSWLEANDKHGAAICMSASDFNTLKTEVEVMCRKMGKRCNYAVPIPSQP